MLPYRYMGAELEKLSFVGALGKSMLRLGGKATKMFDDNIDIKKLDNFSLGKQYGKGVGGSMKAMGGGATGKKNLQRAVGAGTLGTGFVAGHGAFSKKDRPKSWGYNA